MKENNIIVRRVIVMEFSQPGKDLTTFQLIRVQGDFLDQLGFTRDGPITIYQEGNKLIILRESSSEKDKGDRET